MKNKIRESVLKAAQIAFKKGFLPSDQIPEMEIEEPKHPSQGDFSTNFAMVSASVQKMPPREIAKALLSSMPESDLIEKIEIAGPGFINFFLEKKAWYPVVDEILLQDKEYGRSDIGKKEKVQVEFVSANPTGPLHIGHGRGAAVGDAVGNILSFAGFDVQKEYYINDSGRQIRTLGISVFKRMHQSKNPEIEFPEECYQGEYIKSIAKDLLEKKGDSFLSVDEEDAIKICAKYAVGIILEQIKDDLENFGIRFDNWFSEQSLYDSGMAQKIIDDFQSKGLVYKEDGALWFRSEDYGDEKNRVVIRNNGESTYFASDIAYHIEKYERGFDRVIDVWGADHHGYIDRLNSSIVASGRKSEQFNVILVQLVNLLRDGRPVQMSKRAGAFVTLRDIIDEVGKDAARFLFLSRSYDSGLDFDLELAKQKSADNPVYYVQYVHARIFSILSKAKDAKIISEVEFKKASHFDLLEQTEEINLIKILSRFQENIEKSAKTLHPHVIFNYIMNLASAFHGYYNKHKVITTNQELSLARLGLVLAVKKVMRNGLFLLGVSAPERM